MWRRTDSRLLPQYVKGIYGKRSNVIKGLVGGGFVFVWSDWINTAGHTGLGISTYIVAGLKSYHNTHCITSSVQKLEKVSLYNSFCYRRVSYSIVKWPSCRTDGKWVHMHGDLVQISSEYRREMIQMRSKYRWEVSTAEKWVQLCVSTDRKWVHMHGKWVHIHWEWVHIRSEYR